LPRRRGRLIFIGPFDLSATVGQMGNIKHPDVARRRARRRQGVPRAVPRGL